MTRSTRCQASIACVRSLARILLGHLVPVTTAMKMSINEATRYTQAPQVHKLVSPPLALTQDSYREKEGKREREREREREDIVNLFCPLFSFYPTPL